MGQGRRREGAADGGGGAAAPPKGALGGPVQFKKPKRVAEAGWLALVEGLGLSAPRASYGPLDLDRLPARFRAGRSAVTPEAPRQASSPPPSFVPRFLALLAGYENLTAPLFALSQ